MLRFTSIDQASILFRCWVSLLPLFIFYKIYGLTFFPNIHPMIWADPSIEPWQTWSYLAFAGLGFVLVWTKRGLPFGLVIIGVIFLYLKKINYGFFWGWASMINIMMGFRYGILYSRKPLVQFWCRAIFFFYFFLIYWIPNIDRLASPEWFNGRIVTTFLSMPYFARWPITIPAQYTWWLAPLGIGTMLIEIAAPFLLLFKVFERKKIAYAMIFFHSSLMLVSDVELWQPFMVLLWLDIRNIEFDFATKTRTVILSALLLCLPFTYICPPQLHFLSFNPVAGMLTNAGIFVFRNLHLFSSPRMPVISSYKLTFSNGKDEREPPLGLAPYTMRFFLGFYEPRPFRPLSILCRDQDDVLKIRMESITDTVGWLRKTAITDCKKRETVLVIDRQSSKDEPVITKSEVIEEFR